MNKIIFDSFIDQIIELLVRKGMAGVDNKYFNDVRIALTSKLRGQVLFHSDIRTRNIFITYSKVKN